MYVICRIQPSGTLPLRQPCPLKKPALELRGCVVRHAGHAHLQSVVVIVNRPRSATEEAKAPPGEAACLHKRVGRRGGNVDQGQHRSSRRVSEVAGFAGEQFRLDARRQVCNMPDPHDNRAELLAIASPQTLDRPNGSRRCVRRTQRARLDKSAGRRLDARSLDEDGDLVDGSLAAIMEGLGGNADNYVSVRELIERMALGPSALYE